MSASFERLFTCCMIRNGPTKNSISKDLWKLRHRTSLDVEVEGTDTGEQECKALLNSVLKHLNQRQVEGLLEAVKSQGASQTSCVLVDRSTTLSKRIGSLGRFALRVWRWPELSDDDDLKSLPDCQHSDKEECVNPYHLSKVLNAGSCTSCCEVPGKCLYHSTHPLPTRLPLPDTEYSSGGSGSSASLSNDWCQVAYWELRKRVGRLFPVYTDSVDIFQDNPHAAGLCLGTLHENSQPETDRVRKTRSRIGAGLCLARYSHTWPTVNSSSCSQSVWLFNKSQAPVFVNSSTLCCSSDNHHHMDCNENGATLPPVSCEKHCDNIAMTYDKVIASLPGSCGNKVFPSNRCQILKVPPGHCVQVYDSLVASELAAFHALGVGGEPGPSDFHSVHVSFVKGWGAGYKRQLVDSTPCWLEILIKVDR